MLNLKSLCFFLKTHFFFIFIGRKIYQNLCSGQICSQIILSNYVIYFFCLQQFQYSSCKELKKKRPDSISGIYELTTKNGDTINVYCDMVTDGGALINSFNLDNHRAYLNHRQPSLHLYFWYWEKQIRINEFFFLSIL